ncbi:hypothetical protein MBLNU457_g0341t1 [Dothideomycetes sp. NU457]
MKQETDEDITAQQEAWTAGHLFVNNAQRARFLAFRSGGRLGLISLLKEQSQNLFPGQSTPMSIDADNTTREIDSSILAVLKDSSDKQIEAMILDPAPKSASVNDADDLPTQVGVRSPHHQYHAPDQPGIYGICVRTAFGDPMCLAQFRQVLEELEAYHAGLVLDPDRNVMIKPRQTAAEAQRFQKIDEQVGGCHYVETSLLRESTRRYCTAKEHMREYQVVSQKWREISAAVSAHFSGLQADSAQVSSPLLTYIGASKSVKATALDHADGEMPRLMGLVDAVAQMFGKGNNVYDRLQARTYLLASLPDPELVPMAEHVFALLVGAYVGHGGLKQYAADDTIDVATEVNPRKRRTRVRDDAVVKVEPERDISIVTAHPEMYQRVTAIVNGLQLKRKSFGETEQSVTTAEQEKQILEVEMEELETRMKDKAKAFRSEANAAKKRYKKLKSTADKIEKLTKMALVPDADIVEIEESDSDSDSDE